MPLLPPCEPCKGTGLNVRHGDKMPCPTTGKGGNGNGLPKDGGKK